MRRYSLPLLLPLSTLALAACGAPAPALGTMTQGIVGGAVDTGDPAVVALVEAGFTFCSGTLISPSAVLTAGHCVYPLGQALPYLVAFGSDASHPTSSVRVRQQVSHPQYAGQGQPFDLGLYQLDTPVTGVLPLGLNSVAIDAAFVGQSVRHVGFGISDEAAGSGGGIKRMVSYPVTQVQGMLVFSGAPGEQTCTGDSGGPGLMQLGDAGVEQVAMVVSDGPNCHTDGWDDRVDAVLGWIQQTTGPWEAPSDGGNGPGKKGGCASGGLDAGALASLLLLGAVRRRIRTARERSTSGCSAEPRR